MTNSTACTSLFHNAKEEKRNKVTDLSVIRLRKRFGIRTNYTKNEETVLAKPVSRIEGGRRESRRMK